MVITEMLMTILANNVKVPVLNALAEHLVTVPNVLQGAISTNKCV